MSNTTTMNISLPDSLRTEIEKEIKAGGYGNTSEFFRDAVRELLKKRQEAKLEALLIEGIESGEATPVTHKDFEDIKARGLKRIEKIKQKAKK